MMDPSCDHCCIRLILLAILLYVLTMNFRSPLGIWNTIRNVSNIVFSIGWGRFVTFKKRVTYMGRFLQGKDARTHKMIGLQFNQLSWEDKETRNITNCNFKVYGHTGDRAHHSSGGVWREKMASFTSPTTGTIYSRSTVLSSTST